MGEFDFLRQTQGVCMFIERRNDANNVRPRRGRIYHCSNAFYKHMMPLASFHAMNVSPNLGGLHDI